MSSSAPRALDVRPLPARRKAESVLRAFDRLKVGESFVLVNDSDPTPIRSHLEAERPDEGRWVSLQSGPYVWYVRITRRAR